MPVDCWPSFICPIPNCGAGAAGSEVVSKSFLETLLAAPDRQTMRQLVAERADLVKAAVHVGGSWDGRPMAREQRATGFDDPPLDAEAFARAIR